MGGTTGRRDYLRHAGVSGYESLSSGTVQEEVVGRSNLEGREH